MTDTQSDSRAQPDPESNLSEACRRYRDELSSFLDADGPEPTDHCPDCKQWSGAARRLQSELQSLGSRPGPDLTERLYGAITGSGPAGRARSWRFTAVAGVAAAAVAALLVAGAGALAGGHGHPAAEIRQVSGPTGQNPHYPGLIQSPRPYSAPAVTLTDTTGATVDLAASSRGRITLVYFGYTNCPDVCPTDMALNASAVSQLPASVASKVQVVFITTDPNRDSRPVLRRWLDRFDSSFIGLTGDVGRIHQAESALGMPLSYAQTDTSGDDADSGGYAVVHAGYTMVFTPDGVSHLFYEDSTRPSQVAAALQKLSAEGYQS
jgi:protein SCO1